MDMELFKAISNSANRVYPQNKNEFIGRFLSVHYTKYKQKTIGFGNQRQEECEARYSRICMFASESIAHIVLGCILSHTHGPHTS
jgi:hypothetical protein